MRLLGKGSAKDIFEDPKHTGHLAMKFSDRVSVFDYGALPYEIPQKGASLKSTAQSIFDFLEEKGVPTAYNAELSSRSDLLYMRAAYDGKFYSEPCELRFLPVEIIYRWGVPQGSSLLKRSSFKIFERFKEPMVEITTKLEAQDRLLSREEWRKMIANDHISQQIEDMAHKVATLMGTHFEDMGLELWDGKIECAWDERNSQVVVVDSIGPDELRVNLPGLRRVPLSKELLRQWLAQSNWAFDVRREKATRGSDWKNFVGEPPRLGRWRTERLSGLYASFSQSIMSQNSQPLWDWVRDDQLKPKVHVMGSGGREAAVKWRLGNEGCQIAESLDQSVDLAWVSMDGDLAEGKVDELEKQGYWTYGPRKEAAKVEWSKLFGREVAQAAGLRNPKVTQEVSEAKGFTRLPVVKKNGLAAGKGVVLPESKEELEKILEDWKDFDLLFEERCQGPEASAFFAVNTGYYSNDVKFLGSAQDFKRRFAGDEGPNTGGMGSYAPHPAFTREDEAQITQWAQDTADELAKRGLCYNGILYLGLMRDSEKGWVLIEYNSRLGDPETQALVKLWDEGRPLLRSILALGFEETAFTPSEKTSSVCLSLVHPQYPGKADSAVDLSDWELSEQEDVSLFRTSSLTGRVAYLVGRGADQQQAGDRVFEVLVNSPWKELLEWRPDILP